MRVVNAWLTGRSGYQPDSCRMDVSSESAAGATATILTGEDPYAGRAGEESPTSPVKTVVDLTGGVYAAPAWSFSTIVIGD